MIRPTVHVVGAGVSGLSAAVSLAATAEAQIVVHESAAIAGGRRRPLFDEATQTAFDSGADFVLSSWTSALALIEAIGARAQWREAAPDGIAFADLATGERWRLRLGRGRLLWRLLDPRRRPPGVALRDFWPAARLARAPAAARLADYAPRFGTAAERVWRPFALAALNADLDRASARLAGAALSASRWGGATLLSPSRGLARGLVEPALKTLARRGAATRFERKLIGLAFADGRVAALDFVHDRVDLAPGDAVVLATPPQEATALAPGLVAPQEFAAAVHVHFAAPAASDAPPIMGVANGDDPLAARRRGQHDGGHPRRRRLDRPAARPARRRRLARRRGADRPARRRARLARGQAQARRLRRDAGAGRAAAGLRHAMAQPVPRRRLCADRPARLSRRLGALRRDGRRARPRLARVALMGGAPLVDAAAGRAFRADVLVDAAAGRV